MRFIPTIVHGLLDYVYVILLLFVPYIFGFSSNNADAYVMDIAASAVLIYSIHTKYELGLFKNIPMRTHLTIDLIIGVLLAASPWLLGFANEVYGPHLFFGLFAVVASLCSKPTSSTIEKSTYAENRIT